MKSEESFLESSTTRKIIDYFPYLLLIFSLIGFTVQLVIFQSIDFTLRSSVIFVPMALAGLYLLRKVDANNNQTYNFGRIMAVIRERVSLGHLVLLNAILFLWSIVALLSFDSRNVIFFVLLTAICLVTVLQIMISNTSISRKVVLAEICALSLTLAWSLTLKYSLYFGFTDTLSHMHFISAVLNDGNINGLPLTYINFPIFHILISEGVLLTGLEIGPALFILMALAWLTGIFLAYLISSKIFNSTTIGLLIALLFAISPEIIFYSSYTITRSLAFIFFILILYLIFNKTENNRFIFTLLTIIMSWVLIFTHLVTVVYVIPILFVVYLIQRMTLGKKEEASRISSTFLILFTITIIAYLFFASYDTTRLLLTYYLSPLFQDTGSVSAGSGGDLLNHSSKFVFHIRGILRPDRSMVHLEERSERPFQGVRLCLGRPDILAHVHTRGPSDPSRIGGSVDLQAPSDGYSVRRHHPGLWHNVFRRREQIPDQSIGPPSDLRSHDIGNHLS